MKANAENPKVQKRKVFDDLRVYDNYKAWLKLETKPMDYVVQLCERWALLLRAKKLTLPNYSQVYLMLEIVEDATSTKPTYEFKDLRGPFEYYKHVHVLLTNPPIKKQPLTEFFNQLAADAIEWTGDLLEADRTILKEATGEIIELGDDIQIPLRSKENDKYIAEILISPRGPFHGSGTAYISLFNKKKNKRTV